MKNPLNRIKKILNDTKKLMSELKDRGVENHCNWTEKKEKKWEEINSPLKQHQVSQGSQNGKEGAENISEDIIAENILNLGKETSIQV